MPKSALADEFFEVFICGQQQSHVNVMSLRAADGFELAILQEQGVISMDTEILVVGPDSPVEDLRKLSLD